MQRFFSSTLATLVSVEGHKEEKHREKSTENSFNTFTAAFSFFIVEYFRIEYIRILFTVVLSF